jgi:hypothetical protein
VGFANGENLFQVVFAVDELKLAPLIDSEWPEGHMAGASAGGTEEFFGFSAEEIELREVVGRCLGEIFTAERMSCGCDRCDQRWGFAAVGKIPEMDEGVLNQILRDVGFGFGGGAFGETSVESHLGARVAEQKMLHDLLNVPLAGARRRLELGLCGVQAVEGVCDLSLKLMEGGVHKAGSRYTGWGAAASGVCG